MNGLKFKQAIDNKSFLGYRYCNMPLQVILRYMEFLILVKDEDNIDGGATGLVYRRRGNCSCKIIEVQSCMELKK